MYIYILLRRNVYIFFCGTRRLSCCDILRKGVGITGFDVQKMLYYFAALTFTWPGPREFQRDTSTNPNRGNSTPSPPTCWVLGFCGVYDFGPFFGLLKGPTGGYIIHHCPCFKVDLGVLWVAGRILMESRGSLQSCPMISEGIDLIPRKDVTRIDICIYICIYIYVYIYIYLEPKWPLFLKLNPSKQGLLQPNQGPFGFQVYIYIG